MNIKIISLASLLFSFGAIAGQCSKDNFDQCKTCDQLSKAIDIKNPNHGDYYRGALWNGLYASYVRNCPAVAKKLLSNGAKPTLGGPMGSMGAAIAQKWPHNSESINMLWADMLIKGGFGVSDYTGDYKSAIEYWALNPDSVEYKSVWNRLVSSSERKPLEPSRNIEWCAGEGYKSVTYYSLKSCTDKAISRLDDGISPASDISSVAVMSCQEEVNKFIAGVACRVADKQYSDSDKKKMYDFVYNDKKSNSEITNRLKEKTMEQVLEHRSKVKK
ncbi:hypothetical protein I6G37_09970 [Serratia rubidaea]|nr:hypothetical protein I6G37_09970 [Serratia rubidaea]